MESLKEILSSEKIVILSRELNQIWGSAVYLDLVFLSSTGAETSRFEWEKSVLRSVLNIFVSQSTEKMSSIGVSFLKFFSNVQDCQCNMGKFEGNSLIRKIVILSRELNQIWGSAVYLDLVFRSCMGAETSRFEWGNICVSQSTEKTSSIGVSFF